MTENNKIVGILIELLQADVKGSAKLPRGLVIGYTPQGLDPRPSQAARLVWSRRGGHPSEIEDKIMETAVSKALRACNNRALVAGPMFRSPLVLRKGWGSSMVQWRWVGTAELGDLQGLERERAKDWLNGR